MLSIVQTFNNLEGQFNELQSLGNNKEIKSLYAILFQYPTILNNFYHCVTHNSIIRLIKIVLHPSFPPSFPIILFLSCIMNVLETMVM